MPRKGKGKHWPIKPMDPEIKARFEKLIKPPKAKPAFNPKWPMNYRNINQLWHWETFQDINF